LDLSPFLLETGQVTRNDVVTIGRFLFVIHPTLAGERLGATSHELGVQLLLNDALVGTLIVQISLFRHFLWRKRGVIEGGKGEGFPVRIIAKEGILIEPVE